MTRDEWWHQVRHQVEGVAVIMQCQKSSFVDLSPAIFSRFPTMARLLLSVALLLISGVQCGAATPPLNIVDESYSFEDFMADFDKSYSDEELARRRGVFDKNLRHILDHNSKDGKGHVLGINQFMDLESDEVPRGYDKSFHASWNGGLLGSISDGDTQLTTQQLDLPFDIDDVSSLPKYVDWRSHGVVTPVKCQGFCGSCWAFASTTVLESHIAIETGVLYTLAVQELVSCVDNPRSCGGSECNVISDVAGLRRL